MTTTVEARYHEGKLILPEPLPLSDNARVRITIQANDTDSDANRAAWLRISEQSLMTVWDNSEDDAFNELLAK